MMTPKFWQKKFLAPIALMILVQLSSIAISQVLAADLPSQVNLLSTSDNSAISNFPSAPKRLTLIYARSIIHRARDAWLAGDADAFSDLFMPKGEFIVPGQRWVGRATIRQAVIDFSAAYSVTNIDIRRIVIDGTQVVVEWHWQDKEKTTGNRSAADDAIVIDFNGGQISRWREYIDTKTPDPQ